MLSVITENAFAKLSFNEPIEGDITPQEQTKGTKKPRPVSKLDSNRALGKEIHRDWMRYKKPARRKNLLTQYTDLSDEQATLLGDVAKEMYYQANETYDGEKFIKRYQTDDGIVNFELTPHAVTQTGEGRLQA